MHFISESDASFLCWRSTFIFVLCHRCVVGVLPALLCSCPPGFSFWNFAHPPWQAASQSVTCQILWSCGQSPTSSQKKISFPGDQRCKMNPIIISGIYLLSARLLYFQSIYQSRLFTFIMGGEGMEMKKLRVVWRSLRTLQLKSPRVRRRTRRRRRRKKRKKEGGKTHFPLYGERILLFRKICKSGSLQICLVVRKELHFLSLLCRILSVFLRLPPLHLLLQLLPPPSPPHNFSNFILLPV